MASWFRGFLVSWFLSFLVSQFLGFLVSEFPSFITNFYSKFQVDIGPVPKILKICLGGSSSFSVPIFPNKCRNGNGFHILRLMRYVFFENVPMFSLYSSVNTGSYGSQNPESMEFEGFGP